jgi:hypothetical protein
MHSKFTKLLAVMVLASMTLTQSALAAGEATQARKKSTAAAKKAVPAVTAEDLQQLKDLLQAQQQQLESLKQQMAQRDQQLNATVQALNEAKQASADAQQKAAAAQASADEAKPAVEALKTDVTDVKGTLTQAMLTTQDEQKRVGAIEATAGRFRWIGDVRTRLDWNAQDGTQQRYRPRIRVRLGVEGKLNEDFIAGVALATGGISDPTSTNSTLGEGFQRKYVSLDRGFVTYNPTSYKWFSVTGGKFAATWQKTNQTFDPDINPEGLSEKLSFNIKNQYVKNISLIGVQLYLNETNNTSTFVSTIKTSHDAMAFGGQVQAKLQIGSRWTMTPSYMLLNFRNESQLVNGTFSNTSPTAKDTINLTNAQIPGLTGTVSGFAPNGMTNALCAVGTGATAIPSFCSKFLYSDLILNNVIQTKSARLPINVLFEFERNLNAAKTRNLGSDLYQFEASIGQTKNKKDFQVGYAYSWIEQDAVIASFAESDQRFPTNVQQNRFFGIVKVAPNTTVGYTQWIGRALNTNAQSSAFGFSAAGVPFGYGPTTVKGGKEPWYKRGQFDVIYTF